MDFSPSRIPTFYDCCVGSWSPMFYFVNDSLSSSLILSAITIWFVQSTINPFLNPFVSGCFGLSLPYMPRPTTFWYLHLFLETTTVHVVGASYWLYPLNTKRKIAVLQQVAGGEVPPVLIAVRAPGPAHLPLHHLLGRPSGREGGGEKNQHGTAADVAADQLPHLWMDKLRRTWLCTHGYVCCVTHWATRASARETMFQQAGPCYVRMPLWDLLFIDRKGTNADIIWKNAFSERPVIDGLGELLLRIGMDRSYQATPVWKH